MKKLFIILAGIAFIWACGFTGPSIPTSTNLTPTPELKLKIEGVQTVKAEVSDQVERKLSIEEKQAQIEVEKWQYEKREKDRQWLKSKVSNFCDIEDPIPTFNLYSHISMMDWQNMQKDFSVLWELGHRKVNIRVFSGGGSAFAGLGIADVITEWVDRGMEIRGKAYGLIASATVPIFAACSTRVAGKSTLFMVHEASTFKFFAIEKHSDINAEKAMFDMMLDKYCAVLVSHSKKNMAFWKEKIKETTWFTVESAMEWGLVDAIE